MPPRSHATINYLLSMHYIRQCSIGRRPLQIHARNRTPAFELFTITKKLTPPCHLQGWSFQKPPRHFQGWSYQNHHIIQYREVKKNPLHNAQGRTTHQLWTQRPSPGALAHKPQIPLASSPPPKRPSAGTHASFSKVSLCLSSTKRPDNPYNTDN